MKGLKLLASLVREAPDISIWSWATVTDDSPLRVQLDGEDTPLDVTPDTLIGGLAVNDRVWVQLVTNANPTRQYRRLVVMGRAAGGPPAGSVHVFTGATTPTGYLPCDGNAVSRTTYAVLFGVIGTTYGAGNGTTTFNVPNLKGRVVVGRDPGQVAFDVLGETGGEKTHTLTVAEMPSHTHTTRNYAGAVLAGAGTGTRFAASTSGSISAMDAGSDQSNNTGGDGAHNNLQPYMALNYIIKT